MSSGNLSIGRGWAVISADGKRVGDVTEVHPHYLLVSRGVILVRDMFLPLGTVERVEEKRVILSVTYDVLRSMNLAHEPPALTGEATAPIQDPAPTGDASGDYTSYEQPGYAAETPGGEYTDTWSAPDQIEADPWSTGIGSFDEMPSYTKPQPNGLVEVESGVNLAFADLGYGAAILLLQGWPFDSTIWEPLPTLLAQDHRVAIFDPRGTGGSDRPWDFYSVELQVNDLHRVIVEQALHEVTVVAWSTGALVALQYAHDHRERVARLLLLDPLIPAWLAHPDAAERFGTRPQLDGDAQHAWAEEIAEDRPAFHERLVDQLTERALSGPKRQWIWQRLMEGAPHAQLKTWQAFVDYDPTHILSEVSVPVTILHGEDDRLAPTATTGELASLLPRAQALILSDCGHTPFLDQRAAVIKAIEDLLGVVDHVPEEDAVEDGEIEQEPDPAVGVESESPPWQEQDSLPAQPEVTE